MNESGESAGPARGDLRVPIEQVVVVHDEIDLPFGEIKTKLGGGVAGHNGLKSLAQGFGSNDFWRVRVGVGRPDSTDPEIVSSYVLGRFTEPDDEVSDLIARRRRRHRAPRGPDRRVDQRSSRVSATTLLGRRRGRAAAARSARRPATRSTPRCSTSSSPTSRGPRRRRGARPGDLVDRPHGALGRRRRPGAARAGGGRPADGAVRALYDELTAFPKPTVAACHGACVGGGAEIAVAATCGSAAATCACAFPAGARRPGRPRTAGDALRPLGRQVPAADGEGGRRRRGLQLGARAQGRARGAHRGGGAAARRAVADNPPEAVARLKRMLHESTGSRTAPAPRARARWTGLAPARAFRIASDAAARPARRGLVSGLAGPVTARR